MKPAASMAFNPADYFTFVLDQDIRGAGMPGGWCGFVLELGSEPDLAALQIRLDLLVERFPRATARIVRQGKRYAWLPTARTIVLERLQSDDTSSCQQIVVEIFNRSSDLPLSVHWIASGVGGSLLLVWNHPLLDARGAKIVLDFLCADSPENFKESPSLIMSKLAQWSLWKKLQLLFKAKRHNDLANSVDSCLPTQTVEGAQTLRLKVHRFNDSESKQIGTIARQHTGVAGRTLYYLGCFIRAMEQVGSPVAKEGYCIPYAFNLRRQNAPTPVFANHVGCLFARASREQARDRNTLFGHLLSQYQQAIRDELDMAYLPLMWLGQWLTPGKYAQILRKQHSGNELSSLWFSDIGDLSWGKKGFLNCPVVGMYHLCWMTLPPGLALLAGQLDGLLTLSFSYLHPAVDENWLDAVINKMSAELLEVSGA
jgi:hypothetical protein